MKANAVYIESAGGVKHVLFQATSEEEARRFCEENQWSWMDENGFVWHLDFVD